MFGDIDENFKKTMQGWYRNNILPIFEQARRTIALLAKEGKLIPEFYYWWASYMKNSTALFELMLIDKYSNQSAFTMRILMEIAADTLFMSQNTSSLDRFKKYQIDALGKIKNYSYQDFVKTSKKFILQDEQTHGLIKTRDRIKKAFERDGLEYYDYLCCYTHLNYLGVTKDIDTSIEYGDEMNYRLEFVKYYPETFIAMIRAAENFAGENSLFDKNNTKKLKTAISNLVLRHSLGIVE